MAGCSSNVFTLETNSIGTCLGVSLERGSCRLTWARPAVCLQLLLSCLSNIQPQVTYLLVKFLQLIQQTSISSPQAILIRKKREKESGHTGWQWQKVYSSHSSKQSLGHFRSKPYWIIWNQNFKNERHALSLNLSHHFWWYKVCSLKINRASSTWVKKKMLAAQVWSEFRLNPHWKERTISGKLSFDRHRNDVCNCSHLHMPNIQS